MKIFITLLLFITSIILSQAGNDKESQGLKEQLEKLVSENQDMPAMILALKDPKLAQAILREYQGTNTKKEFIGWLIQSEMLLLEKKNDEALQMLKQFIVKIEPIDSKKTWKDGVIPANYYLSTLSHDPRLQRGSIANGGITDNLILQRLFFHKQDDLAENEYQRIIDTRNLQINNDFSISGRFSENFDLVIEYNNFLRTRNKNLQANRLLLNVLDKINLDSVFMTSSNDDFYSGVINAKPPMKVEQFIKISYGLFKLDNNEDELFNHLAQSKNKSAELILAKIQAQLGNQDKALEIAVKHAHTLELTPDKLAFHLGMTYHYFAKYEEAIVELEKFMKLKELADDKKKMPSNVLLDDQSIRQNLFQTNTTLQECYLATHNTPKLIEAKLAALESQHYQHYQIPGDLVSIKAFAIKSNHAEIFNDWASDTLNDEEASLLVKAHVAHIIGDVAQMLKHSKEAALKGSLYDYTQWGRFYTELGKRAEWIAILRERYLNANEDRKLIAQRDLIKFLSDEATDAEIISFYENVLASDESFSHEVNYNFAAFHFDGKGHVTNRLLRLYHRNNLLAQFDALAIKVANSEKFEPETYINANDSETALAFYISKSNKSKILALKQQLNPEKWHRTIKLIDWTLAGGVNFDIKNKPKNDLIKTNEFSVIASDQNVRDIARNKTYIFTAHPYGIAVYDHSGKQHKRIYVPNNPHHLTVNENHLWIGTEKGVYQLDLKSWELSRLDLNENIPNIDSDDEISLEITALALQNDLLWIGSNSSVFKYDTANKEIQIYTNIELGYREGGNGDWNRFMFQKSGHVWVSGRDEATRRYDSETDTWLITLPLIGIINDRVWLSQHINQRLNERPALFDDYNLTTKPCRILRNSPVTSDWGKSLEELHISGEIDNQPVFYSTRGGTVYYQYLPQTHELKPFPENWDPNTMKSLNITESEYEDKETIEYSNGAIKNEWLTWLRLSDNSILKGFKYSINTTLPHIWPIEIDKIGLHLYKDRKYSHRISNSGIYGSAIFELLETNQGVWIGTDTGLSLVTKEGALIANYTTDHGLPEGRCTSAVEIDGTCYFAFNGGSKEGGLAYIEKNSSRFHTLTDLEGLSNNRINHLKKEETQLKITYGTIDYSPDFKFAPTMLDTAKMKFSKRSIATEITTRDKDEELPKMPHELGLKIGEKIINGRTWIYGNEAVIIPHVSAAKNNYNLIPVKLVESEQLKLHAHAVKIDEEDKLTLKEKLEHPNHYLVEEALSMTSLPENITELTPLLISLVKSPYKGIQTKAAKILLQLESKESINALMEQMNSKNAEVKYFAIITAAKYAKKLPIEELTTYLRPYFYRSYTENSGDILKRLLARGELTDKDTIRVLLKYPESGNIGWNQSEPKSYPEFSKIISGKPELIAELLKADHIYSYKNDNRRFMFDLFREVDKSVLPILHDALKSKDRIVAANAALACAAIGEKDSIPHLIKALKIESALTQHSVITALSLLKAEEAIPHLLSINRILRQNVINSTSYSAFAMNCRGHFEIDKNANNPITIKDEFQLPVHSPALAQEYRDSEMTTDLETIFDALKVLAPEKTQAYFREHITSAPYCCGKTLALLKLAQGEDIKENIKFLNNISLTEPDDVKLVQEIKTELMLRK